jgi:dTDP-4-amino-4,6-dideoxygalactose transaminase
MDEIQAAILLARLPHLDAEILRRAELARFYDERLRPLAPHVRTPVIVDHGVEAPPVYYVYLIRARRRDELIAHLTAHGIGTEVYYPRPIHLQPCFSGLGYRAGDFPVAELACQETVALPLYPDLSFDQAEAVCRAIETFYSKE